MLFPKLKEYVVFGFSVSSNFIFNVFAVLKGVIIGANFIGGEIINSLVMSFSFIYSSKRISISLPVKLMVKFSGLLLTIIGAMVSFKPPEGEPFFAQSTKESRNKKAMGI